MAYVKCIRNLISSTVPDGKTVTPTDDISIWLACGGRSETYTTLSQVLADSTCLSALISSNNAVDYLVRSKSFAKSEALIPIMTSNTTPIGVASAESENDSTHAAWKAFDGTIADEWVGYNDLTSHWIQYAFPSPIVAKGAVIYVRDVNLSNVTIQGSIDGTTFNTLATFSLTAGAKKHVSFDTYSNYTYYRFNNGTRCGVGIFQLYSVAEGVCDNSTAMSYIGLNNYASNTLLADSIWREAICNSTYFESVLNVKVPIMTSNNTPSGVCSGTSNATGSEFWKLFNGQTSTSNMEQWNYPTTSDYVQYSFGKGVKGVYARYYAEISYNITIKSKVSGNFVTMASGNNSYNAWTPYIFNSYENSENGDFRVCFPNVPNDRLRIYQIEFYGRADV